MQLYKNPSKPAHNSDKDLIWQVKNAIASANLLALYKNKCLIQSLTGRFMFKKRGIESKLSIGVNHNQGKEIIAHAWLNTGNIEIVRKGLNYRELHSF